MMKKTLLVLLSGIALASMASTVDAKHCRTKKAPCEKKVCAPKCAPVEICCEPTQEVRGVLCKAVKANKYIPQPDKCCERKVPCKPEICQQEETKEFTETYVEMECEEIEVPVVRCRKKCVTVPCYKIVEDCEKHEIDEYYVEYVKETRNIPVEKCRTKCVTVPCYSIKENPDKCCKEMVPCPPKCVPCIEYVPIDVNVKAACPEPVDACDRGSSATAAAADADDNIEMEK